MTRICALVVVSLAGSAFAQTPGDIIFTSQQGNGVRMIGGFAPTPAGTATQLWNSANPATRLHNITSAPDGNYYVADGRFPFPNTTDAGIIRLSNLFTGATASQLQQGNPIQNPVGLVWDNNTNRLYTVSNPGSPQLATTIDGVFGVDLAGNVNTVFTETFPIPPRPAYHAAHSIIKDPRPGSNDYLISNLNGGVGTDPNPIFGFDAESSTIWRMRWNGASYAVDSTPMIDFDSSFTGASGSFYNARGMAAVPGSSSIYVADIDAGAINRVDMDALGNFASITTIVTGLAQPETIIYNPYSNKLVFSERSTSGGGPLVGSKISEINLDGTGYRVMYDGEHAQGFAIVPTPGAATVLGLAGLLAVRRRRAR
ncbi:MAG TPA: hypothetical protein VD971_12980 [Phycisphaerales bacterium]|nr:hypothetical protein [Phycisphaerales bacterium]